MTCAFLSRKLAGPPISVAVGTIPGTATIVCLAPGGFRSPGSGRFLAGPMALNLRSRLPTQSAKQPRRPHRSLRSCKGPDPLLRIRPRRPHGPRGLSPQWPGARAVLGPARAARSAEGHAPRRWARRPAGPSLAMAALAAPPGAPLSSRPQMATAAGRPPARKTAAATWPRRETHGRRLPPRGCLRQRHRLRTQSPSRRYPG